MFHIIILRSEKKASWADNWEGGMQSTFVFCGNHLLLHITWGITTLKFDEIFSTVEICFHVYLVTPLVLYIKKNVLLNAAARLAICERARARFGVLWTLRCIWTNGYQSKYCHVINWKCQAMNTPQTIRAYIAWIYRFINSGPKIHLTCCLIFSFFPLDCVCVCFSLFSYFFFLFWLPLLPVADPWSHWLNCMLYCYYCLLSIVFFCTWLQFQCVCGACIAFTYISTCTCFK